MTTYWEHFGVLTETELLSAPVTSDAEHSATSSFTLISVNRGTAVNST